LHLENVLFRSDAATSEIGEVLGISRQGPTVGFDPFGTPATWRVRRSARRFVWFTRGTVADE